MNKTKIKSVLIALMLLASFSLCAQQVKQRKNKFEIALGVNAVDVYLNNGYGLNAKTEESFIADFLNTNDWNIYTKAKDTYVDAGNKESSLPPISLRVAYYFSDQIALGMHFSANYLDIIDLCYNAVGLPDMDFTNLEAFVRYRPSKETRIEPYAQLTLGKSWVNNTSAAHVGMDVGTTVWINDNLGVGFTTGAKSPVGTDLSEYFQHTIGLVYRSDNKKLKITNKLSRIILFDYDMDDLKPEVSQYILPEVINEMIKRPSLRIIIEGHADEDGLEKYNLELSMRRAKAVADFLINAGISANRIDIQALGETAPAVKGNDEDARARNRRVVILEVN